MIELSPKSGQASRRRRGRAEFIDKTQIIVEKRENYQYIVFSVLTKRKVRRRIVYVELSALYKGATKIKIPFQESGREVEK